MTKRLTDLQQGFVLNYIKNGFNAKQAALDAGYSQDTAQDTSYQLTKHPDIKPLIDKAIARVDAKLELKLGITMQHKVAKLSKLIDDCFVRDDKGKVNKGLADVGLRAMDMLNKMQGHYAPNRSLAVTVDSTKDRLIEAKRVYKEY